MPERTEVANAKDGSVDFGKIEFTLDDLNRKWAQEHPEAADLEALADGEAAARSGKPRTVSFTYTITESGEVPGVTNDQNDIAHGDLHRDGRRVGRPHRDARPRRGRELHLHQCLHGGRALLKA